MKRAENYLLRVWWQTSKIVSIKTLLWRNIPKNILDFIIIHDLKVYLLNHIKYYELKSRYNLLALEKNRILHTPKAWIYQFNSMFITDNNIIHNSSL